MHEIPITDVKNVEKILYKITAYGKLAIYHEDYTLTSCVMIGVGGPIHFRIVMAILVDSMYLCMKSLQIVVPIILKNAASKLV